MERRLVAEFADQGGHLVHRVGPYGKGRRQKDMSLFRHLLSGLPEFEGIGNISRNHHTENETESEYHAET